MAKKLTRTDEISSGDLFVVYKTSAGDYRGAPASVAIEFFQNNLVFPTFSGFQAYATQYSAPSSTGFDVVINPPSDGDNVHLILTPTTGFAAGEITLPAVGDCIDKQELLVNCAQQVTTLTIDGSGATGVTGAPASLGADDYFRLKFDLLTSTWYRVG